MAFFGVLTLVCVMFVLGMFATMHVPRAVGRALEQASQHRNAAAPSGNGLERRVSVAAIVEVVSAPKDSNHYQERQPVIQPSSKLISHKTPFKSQAGTFAGGGVRKFHALGGRFEQTA